MNILFWFETHSVHGALQGTTLLFFRAAGPIPCKKGRLRLHRGFFFRVTGRMEEDESLTRQVMSMVLENQALFPYLVGWAAFNVVILILLVYIAIRLTLGHK
jgi:hypothetical protein